VDPDTRDVVANRTSVARAEAPTASRMFAGAPHLVAGIADQAGLGEVLEHALGGRAAAEEAFVDDG